MGGTIRWQDKNGLNHEMQEFVECHPLAISGARSGGRLACRFANPQAGRRRLRVRRFASKAENWNPEIGMKLTRRYPGSAFSARPSALISAFQL